MPVIIDKHSPEEHVPFVLPDLLRAIDSVALRHGVNVPNMVVLLLIATAKGTIDLRQDAVTFLATAIDAWKFTESRLKAMPTPETKLGVGA